MSNSLKVIIMPFNLDTAIFIVFLLINIVLGLYSSKGIQTIREYAIGNRNFSTATIVATIVATWIGGGFFCTLIPETYSNGLHFIWVTLLGDFICLSLVALFFAPRMEEFLGKLSIADAMGDLYGKRVQVITAISAFIGVSGLIAMQFKIAGMMFEYALNLPEIYGILSAGFIVTLYSALGGIKSVTFTDTVQFITFAIIIPFLVYFLLDNLDNVTAIKDTINNNPIFDYTKVFNFSEPTAFYHLFIFLFFAIPSFNSSTFQRIAMAKSTAQVTKSFFIAAIVCFIVGFLLCCIGVLILAINPSIIQKDVIKFLISDYLVTGLKGIVLSGVMAMIMSTVDSLINSSAVIVFHDFCKPLKIKVIENELLSARTISLFIGLFAIIISIYGSDIALLKFFILANSFYTPIVSAPFLMALLGFRSSEKSVLLGMITGLLTVLVWKIFNIQIGNSIVFGMVANLTALICSHYLLNQKGGWVGIKNNSKLLEIRKERKRNLEKFLYCIKTFQIIDFYKKNFPQGEGVISALGFFVMISVFSSTNSLVKECHVQYKYLIDVLYPITLCCSAVLISYPLWLQKWKDTQIMGVFWNLIIFWILVCFSFFMVLISEFSEIQLMVFMINVVVISALSKWQLSLFNILLGIILVAFCYKYYYLSTLKESDFISSQFKIIYLLLLVSSTLVLFLKPKQQYQELTEDNNLFLSSKVEDQKHELSRLHELKNEFLRNLEHEAHTPITGITSMGQVLWENYDKFSEKQRRKATQEIAKSSERLNSLVNNLIDLSKLENLNYKLNKTKVNLTDLVYERVEICQKLYIEEKDKENLNFDLKIEDKLTALCDEYYTARTIDNIVINAIQYCKKGTIAITLKSTKNHTIEFSVQDDGIGIPEEDLLDIFNPFTVSSRTKTPAGGRGVGLALCKKVIDAHNGIISAKNNVSKGSLFRFILPK